MNNQSTDQYHLDFHATDSQLQFGNSIEVSVQGQLDQQEQADVQLLVGKLEKVVKQFLGGDSAGALSKALQIGDLGTVASFELNVQQSAQIALTQEQQVSADGAQALPRRNAGRQDQAKPPSLANQIVDTIHDSVLRTHAASFVTLEREQRLLGCVGTLEACAPLAVGVAHQALGAAFADPRVPPIAVHDFVAMTVKVSVLSELTELPVGSVDEEPPDKKPATPVAANATTASSRPPNSARLSRRRGSTVTASSPWSRAST